MITNMQVGSWPSYKMRIYIRVKVNMIYLLVQVLHPGVHLHLSQLLQPVFLMCSGLLGSVGHLPVKPVGNPLSLLQICTCLSLLECAWLLISYQVRHPLHGSLVPVILKS